MEALTARRHLRPKLATAGEQAVQLLGTVLRIVVVFSGAALQQTAELDAGVFAFARHLERRRRRRMRGGGGSKGTEVITRENGTTLVTQQKAHSFNKQFHTQKSMRFNLRR